MCCGPLTLIVQVNEPLCPALQSGFHITSDPTSSDQTYKIQSEQERIKLLPQGVWDMMEHNAEGRFEIMAKFTQYLSPNASTDAILTTYPSTFPKPTEVIPSSGIKSYTVFQLSRLPQGYEISRPHVDRKCNECITLPKGHRIITHGTVKMLHMMMTFLLCTDCTSPKDSLYVLYVTINTKDNVVVSDGASVALKNDKLVLTQYLRQKTLATRGTTLSSLQNVLDKALSHKYCDNINLLMWLVKCQRYAI